MRWFNMIWNSSTNESEFKEVEKEVESPYIDSKWEGEVNFHSVYNYVLLHLHKHKVGSLKFFYIFDLYNRACGDSDKISMDYFYRRNGIDKNYSSREIMYIRNSYNINSLDMKPMKLWELKDGEFKGKKGFHKNNLNTELLNIIAETLVGMMSSDIATRYNLKMGNPVTTRRVLDARKID